MVECDEVPSSLNESILKGLLLTTECNERNCCQSSQSINSTRDWVGPAVCRNPILAYVGPVPHDSRLANTPHTRRIGSVVTLRPPRSQVAPSAVRRFPQTNCP